MRAAGKEPFPKFYTDSKKEGEVCRESGHITHTLPPPHTHTHMDTLVLGRGVAESAEEGEEDLGSRGL